MRCVIDLINYLSIYLCCSLGTVHYGLSGGGTGRVLLDNLRCRGWEETISDCWHLEWGRVGPNCNHSRDVWVTCDYYKDSKHSKPLGEYSSIVSTYSRHSAPTIAIFASLAIIMTDKQTPTHYHVQSPSHIVKTEIKNGKNGK